MAHQNSSVSGFRIDDAAGSLTDISGSVNNASLAGGNALVDDTGLGDANHTEIHDIGPVKALTLTIMVNTTTEAIFAPIAAGGTSVLKTMELQTITGKYISGEAAVGNVSYSIPIGLQTMTCELRSTAGSGFDHTSVALT